MKLITLVENTSKNNFDTAHGLSFYIESAKHKILFDLGPDDTLFKNAQKAGIDLSQVDTVIISHGHYDHGGALKTFLEINNNAKVYIQEKAFEEHYSKVLSVEKSIGIDSKFKSHPQIVLLNGDYKIDDELSLFTVIGSNKCCSPANDVLFDKDGKDSFAHEQSLLIHEKETALIMGCGHTGIVNIMDKAKEFRPSICIGGFHLFNPSTKQSAPSSLLDEIANELNAYPQVTFYTCHCTGEKAFDYLSKKVAHLHYISCGEKVCTD